MAFNAQDLFKSIFLCDIQDQGEIYPKRGVTRINRSCLSVSCFLSMNLRSPEISTRGYVLNFLMKHLTKSIGTSDLE